MAATTKATENLGQAGQNLIRILISSYFIGVSIGLINGTDAVPLAATFLPPAAADFAGSAVIFVLAYLVMTGIWLRPAALLLGLVMFWSSYVVNFSNEGPIAISDFWRDLTLIGALMLTYVQSAPRAKRGRAMVRWTPRTRRVTTATKVAPRRVAAANKTRVVHLAVRDGQKVAPKPADNIFLDLPADALAS
jgi:uncharacterized membrane protein YphA (DoxX/SURF4 family)